MASREHFDQLIRPFLQKGQEDRTSPWGIVLWWEQRRILYNVIVAGAGLFSGVIAFTAAGFAEPRGAEPVAMPNGFFIPILVAQILFLIGANVCYTGGWIVELISRRFLQRDVSPFATPVFHAGVLFSVAVTFLPAVIWIVYLFWLPSQPR